MNDYGVDLARIHHQGYDDLARRAGPAIVRHLREAEIRAGLIVDLGCGSGILAGYLSDRGYQSLVSTLRLRCCGSRGALRQQLASFKSEPRR